MAPAVCGSRSGNVRIAGGTRRRLTCSPSRRSARRSCCIAGAVMLLRTFLALQAASAGFDASRILAVNVPVTSYGRTPEQTREFYRQLQDRLGQLAGVDRVAIGSNVPWRDGGQTERAGTRFRADGEQRGASNEDPRAKIRSVSPGYFAALGVPLKAGRDFTSEDRDGAERVVIVSETLAQRVFRRTRRRQPHAVLERSDRQVHRPQHRAAAHCRRRARYRR